MRGKFFSISATLLVSVIAWCGMSKPTLAFTSSLVSITPSANDISSQIQAPDGTPTGMGMYGWVGTVDQAYTAVFSVDESPAMLVTPGADIDPATPWAYDATAGTVTVTFTLKGIVGSDSFQSFPNGMGVAILALVPVSTDGSGPPAAMTGAWLSTDLQSWSIIPPSADNVAFGFDLTGASGTTGYFHMFIPTGVIDLMSQLSGQTLTSSDLAVFNGDYQSSLNVTDMTGGAYVDINVAFSSADQTVSAISSTNITKSITAAPRLPLSLTPAKTTVAKNSNAKLFGWIDPAKTNKTVTLYRKLKGATSFSVWKTVTTNSSGYFKTTFTAKKTANYKAKYSSHKSSVVKITVS